MSSLEIPESSIALSAAIKAISLVSISSAKRLSSIPVISLIHSSEVSSIFSKSKFVNTFSGAYEPMPRIPTFVIIFTPYNLIILLGTNLA